MDKIFSRLIILLLCHRIGVKRHQLFRFAGQDNDAWYFFGRTKLWKQTAEGYRESRLGLNYLLNAAAKEVAQWTKLHGTDIRTRPKKPRSLGKRCVVAPSKIDKPRDVLDYANRNRSLGRNLYVRCSRQKRSYRKDLLDRIPQE